MINRNVVILGFFLVAPAMGSLYAQDQMSSESALTTIRELMKKSSWNLKDQNRYLKVHKQVEPIVDKISDPQELASLAIRSFNKKLGTPYDKHDSYLDETFLACLYRLSKISGEKATNAFREIGDKLVLDGHLGEEFDQFFADQQGRTIEGAQAERNQ